MAQQLSGVTIIIFIAAGSLTFILLFIFAKRQIMRFALRSRRGPHVPIGHGAPSHFKRSIDNVIDMIHRIAREPVLLDETLFLPGLQTPVHYYRLKAVNDIKILEQEILRQDSCLKRAANENIRGFLLMALASSIGTGDQKTIQQFCDLYEHARHDPSEFGENEYQLYTRLLHKLIDVAKIIKINPGNVKSSPNRTPIKKAVASEVRIRHEKNTTFDNDVEVAGLGIAKRAGETETSV